MNSYVKRKQDLYIYLNFMFILFFLSILMFVYSCYSTDKYIIVAILPIAYTVGICIITLIDYNFIYNLFEITVISLYGVRMFILPLFIGIFGMPNYESISSNVLLNIDKSIFLQCYEFLAIVLFMSLNKKYNNLYIRKHINIKIFDDLNITKNSRRTIRIITAIITLIVIMYPQLLSKFRPLFFENEGKFIEWKIYNSQAMNNIPSIVYYISTWILIIVKILIVYIAIVHLKKISVKQNKEKKYILLSIFIISSLILIITDDKAGNFFSCIAMVLLLMKLYPNKKRYIKKILTIVILIAIFIFIVISNKDDNFANTMILKMNAYFSGSINIAGASIMPRENLLEYFIGDTLRSIPLIKGLFTDMNMSYILFNKYLGLDTIYNSQILPCIGQGYFYFGYIGAPILSLIIVKLGFICYKKSKTIEDTLGYFIYSNILVFLSVGVVLYDFFLTFSLITQYCIPIVILYKLSKKNMKITDDTKHNRLYS